METYKKVYSVDNALLTYQIWDEHQTTGWANKFGAGVPPAIFDVTGGVADVYYQDEVFLTFGRVMREQCKQNKRFFDEMMDRYEQQLEPIQKTIEEGKPFADASALLTFANQFRDAWIGLDLSYMPDYMEMSGQEQRRSADVREKAFGFYIGSDRIIRRTLQQVFPALGNLSRYLALEELKSGVVPPRTMLEQRARHFVYYQGRIATNFSFEAFCKKEQIRTESVYAPLRTHLSGVAAATGIAKGIVRVVKTEADFVGVSAGDIVVVEDLRSQEAGVVQKAAGIILNQGAYYGSGAIAARAFKKPCLISTRIATMVLQNGDLVDIDANTGVVRVQS